MQLVWENYDYECDKHIPLASVPGPSDGSVESTEACPDGTSHAGTAPECHRHSNTPDHPRQQSHVQPDL